MSLASYHLLYPDTEKAGLSPGQLASFDPLKRKTPGRVIRPGANQLLAFCKHPDFLGSTRNFHLSYFLVRRVCGSLAATYITKSFQSVI